MDEELDFTRPVEELDRERFKKQFTDNPHKVIQLMEAAGLPVEEFRREADPGRTFVKTFFPDMTDNDIDAVEFTFWIAYAAERSIQNLIVESEVKLGGRKEAIEMLVGKIYFLQKIQTVEDLYLSGSRKSEFVSMLKLINELRNHVAHGRFGSLTYKGEPLHAFKTQMRLASDFGKAAIKTGTT